MQDLDQTIRERAYQLWTEGGCQDGHAESHWLSAQRELLTTSLGEIGLVTTSEVTKTKPKKVRASRKKQLAA